MTYLLGNDPIFPTTADGSRDILTDTDWDYTRTWKEMEKLPATGKAKAIGVANLSKSYLQRLLLKADITPAVNQIENHPLLPQQEIVDFCKEHEIHVTAYSPLGSMGSPLFKEEEVMRIAEKHGVGLGTVLLSWHFARGSSVVPKSVTPSRIDENRMLINLDSSDVEALDGVSKSKGTTRYVFPPFGVSN